MANLTQYLREDRIVVPLNAARKTDAIREVASALEGSAEVPDFRQFLSALFRKEGRFGSGVDKGVSLPHYRDDSVKDPVVAIGVSPKGIVWDKDETVHIMVLVGWPDKHAQAYLTTVAEIARALHDDKARKRIIRASTPANVLSAVLAALDETEDVAA